MFWLKYFAYLFGFRSQSELSHMSDVLSKSLINSDVSEDLSRLYKDYSYRIEIKKINKVSRDEKLLALMKDQISNGIRSISNNRTLIKKSTKLTSKRLSGFDLEVTGFEQ